MFPTKYLQTELGLLWIPLLIAALAWSIKHCIFLSQIPLHVNWKWLGVPTNTLYLSVRWVECSDGSDKIECCKFIYICGPESCFLSQLDKCHSWFKLELTAFQHHAVNLCRWKIQSDPSCLLCHTRPCTVHHILNCFPTALNQERYTWHHESILTLSKTFKHNLSSGATLYTADLPGLQYGLPVLNQMLHCN